MSFLINALDGDVSVIGPPILPPLPVQPSTTAIRDAIAFLRRTSLPIEPRAQWPAGGLPQYAVRGTIPAHLRANPGRALCVWGDAGWGELVKQGKYLEGRFSDELVAACVELVHDWNPQPKPKWVTCVPSLRHPHLVPDFAQRVAAGLGLAFHPVIKKSDNRPEQKTMANSVQQARNVDGSLVLGGDPVPHGSVLLIDDIVDSRWSFTICAWLLRKNGSGEVWPLALAHAGFGQ